jgi:hypothetical protein
MAFGVSIKDSGLIPIAQTYVEGVGFVAMRGSIIQITDGSSNVSAAAVFQRAAGTVLNQASAALTASGNSADLVVGPYTQISVDVNITVITGTTPTLVLSVERKGVDGIYYPLWLSSSVTTVSMVSTSIGSGCVIAQSLGTTIRLRWVITGTTPSFTLSASLIGK